MFYGDAWKHEIRSCCNESLFLQAKAALDEQKIPIQFWQLDDWWCKRCFSRIVFAVRCVSS